VVPNGYVQSGTTEYNVTLGSGGSSTGNNFFNYQLGSISGYKWADASNFGVWDGGEVGIPNWHIRLYDDADNDGQIDPLETYQEVQTDANGHFAFNNLLPGSHYVLAEVMEAGYTQTFPSTGQITTDTGLGLYGYDVDIVSGTNFTGVAGAAANNFGNHLNGTFTRTPGFWAQKNGNVFWDGDPNNNPKAGNPDFPTGDLIVLGNTLGGPGSADNYILIGDWNGNGIDDGAGEDTIKILVSDALKMVNASEKLVQDGRYMLMRDVVATWLNKLQGSDTTQVHAYLDEAVDWMYQSSPGVLADGQLSVTDLATGAIKTNTAPWNQGYDIDGGGISPNVASPDILPGGLLHNYLDHYNNTGFIF
jgi:hypothetical protein